MLSAKEVLNRASMYDFDTVKSYIEEGGDTDIYDGDGRSLLANLLQGYYELVYYRDPEEAKIVEGHDEDDNEYWNSHLHRLARMELQDRPHPIKEQIDYLLAKGVGINAVGWKEAEETDSIEPRVETPLFQAVVYHDYCMTEYLLKCGADPCQKLFSRGSYDEDGFEDWLLDEMDFYIMHGHRGDAASNALGIAALLMHYGLDQWGGGYCIDVDHETRTITGHEPRYKF